MVGIYWLGMIQIKFDQLLDAGTDVAVYGHVHKQLLRYGSQGQQIINPGSIGMPYFDWGGVKKITVPSML